MAFNSETPRVEFTASVGQKLFTFLFKIYDKTDLVVYQTPTGDEPNDATDILTADVDYTVSISGDNGGSITLASEATAGDALTLLRELPAIRDVEYQTNGDLLAETLNDDQDYQTYLLGDQQAKESRNVTIPNSSQGVSTELPSTAPDSYLKWNSEGTALENDETIPDAVIEAAQSASDAADSATESAASASSAAGQVVLAEAQVALATAEAESAEDSALEAASSASSIGNSANNVITNGAITSGALALATTEVTGSTPILYTGNGTSQDVPTPMQIANDSGDGTTLAPDWSDTTYSLGDIVIDNSTTGDARAYKCIVAINSATGVSPVLDTTNWILETNQYGGRFWFKMRTGGTYGNYVEDSIRRKGNYLFTDTTAIEVNATNTITSYNTNSVSVGVNVTVNKDAATYVVWVDQTTRKTAGYRTDAGVMQNSKNNTGTDLMAKDSAGNPIIEHYNPTTGFSIIMDTGNGVAGRSIPHSLQSNLGFITSKNLNGTAYGWNSYNKIKGAKFYTQLNTTAASVDDNRPWNDTEPTKENLTKGLGVDINANSVQYITYLQADSANHVIKSCHADATGANTFDIDLDLSISGSFIEYKPLSTTGDWDRFDNVRGVTKKLEANNPTAETTETAIVMADGSATLNLTSGVLYLIQAYSPKYNQPTGGSEITVNSGVDLTYTQGIGQTNLQEQTVGHSVDLSAFAGNTVYLHKRLGADVTGSLVKQGLGQSRGVFTESYLNTLDKVVYDSGDTKIDEVLLGECKIDGQGNII